MNIRTIVVSSVSAAILLTSSAAAAEAQRLPDPEHTPSSLPLTLTIEGLLEQGRHASTIAERRLIHDDLMLVLRDGI